MNKCDSLEVSVEPKVGMAVMVHYNPLLDVC